MVGWFEEFVLFFLLTAGNAISLQGVVPISVCKGRSVGARKSKLYFCMILYPAGWNKVTWQIIGQRSRQSSKCFQVLTGSFESPFVSQYSIVLLIFLPWKTCKRHLHRFCWAHCQRALSELSAECVNLSSSPCPDVSPAISLWLNNRSQDQSNHTLEDFLFIFSLH